MMASIKEHNKDNFNNMNLMKVRLDKFKNNNQQIIKNHNPHTTMSTMNDKIFRRC